jgi:hypothetical protein
MILIDNPNVIFFDVDDCIVLWNPPPDPDGKLKYFDIETPHGIQVLPVNQSTIDDLIQHHMQSHYVVVWSQGGHEWAKQVCDSLGITKKVNMIMNKPKWIVDDLPTTAWTHWIKK